MTGFETGLPLDVSEQGSIPPHCRWVEPVQWEGMCLFLLSDRSIEIGLSPMKLEAAIVLRYSVGIIELQPTSVGRPL